MESTISVAGSPTQTTSSLSFTPDVSVTSISGVGRPLTVIVLDTDDVQPLASVTVTVYDVVDTGLTWMVSVVAVVDHR